jgi:hypothetical protein
MDDTTPASPPGPEDGAAAEPHGDPLLDAAQGRDSGNGSRQGQDPDGQEDETA